MEAPAETGRTTASKGARAARVEFQANVGTGTASTAAKGGRVAFATGDFQGREHRPGTATEDTATKGARIVQFGRGPTTTTGGTASKGARMNTPLHRRRRGTMSRLLNNEEDDDEDDLPIGTQFAAFDRHATLWRASAPKGGNATFAQRRMSTAFTVASAVAAFKKGPKPLEEEDEGAALTVAAGSENELFPPRGRAGTPNKLGESDEEDGANPLAHRPQH